MSSNDNWKSRIMLIGVLLGAIAGVSAAYLIVQRAEREGKNPEMSAGEGVKLGILVLGMLRQIGQLGE